MSTTASRAPIHPGEILAEEYLAPLGITQHRLAVAIHVPPRRINKIGNGPMRYTAVVYCDSDSASSSSRPW